jgi:hypothetical protein
MDDDIESPKPNDNYWHANQQFPINSAIGAG